MDSWQEWMNEVEARASAEEKAEARREAEARANEYGGAYINILARMLGKNCPQRPIDSA